LTWFVLVFHDLSATKTEFTYLFME